MTAPRTYTNSARERINLLPPGKTITLFKISPAGALQAHRELRGDVSFWWRFSFSGKTFRESIGYFDPRLSPKKLEPQNGRFSIAAAERRAVDLAISHANAKGEGGFVALKEAQRRAELQAEEDARRRAEEIAENARRCRELDEQGRLYNLEALMKAYVDHLRRQEKSSSAYDAENIFRNHVLSAAPSIASLAAREVSVDTVVGLLRRLHDSGKGRTANKLRSYLESAFNHAIRARFDPSLPAAFDGFQIQSNPVSGTFRSKSADRQAKNPLRVEDLRRYWQAIQSIEGITGAVLRLHVLTGGQRIAQLVRARRCDVEGDCLRLADSKGRRSTARQHYVPLVSLARNDIDFLLRSAKGEFLFSTTGGEKPMNPLTLTRWAADAGCKANIADFSAKRIRSGIETALAAKGVTQDHRAQLQSHGLSGVQQRHYDGHDYHAEKLSALTILSRILGVPEPSAGKDTPMPQRRFRPRRFKAARQGVVKEGLTTPHVHPQ